MKGGEGERRGERRGAETAAQAWAAHVSPPHRNKNSSGGLAPPTPRGAARGRGRRGRGRGARPTRGVTRAPPRRPLSGRPPRAAPPPNNTPTSLIGLTSKQASDCGRAEEEGRGRGVGAGGRRVVALAPRRRSRAPPRTMPPSPRASGRWARGDKGEQANEAAAGGAPRGPGRTERTEERCGDEACARPTIKLPFPGFSANYFLTLHYRYGGPGRLAPGSLRVHLDLLLACFRARYQQRVRRELAAVVCVFCLAFPLWWRRSR